QRNLIEEAKTNPEMKTAGEIYSKMISSKSSGSGRYFYEGKERLCVYQYVTNSIVGWRIGIVAPLAESPQYNVRNSLLLSALLFLVLGLAASVVISKFAVKPFLRIESQNKQLGQLNKTILAQAEQIQNEHERVKVLLDATPLSCRLWNDKLEIFECNEESLKLFGIPSKEEFMARYYELSPEFQPDGRRSSDVIRETLNAAFNGEKLEFEWVHQTLDGVQFPCEITLVKVRYDEGWVVAGYTRDLSEQKKMLEEIEQRDKLLTTGHSTAALLLSTEDDDDIVESLMKSMEFVGHTTNVDRVQIWRNEVIDGTLYSVHTYQWLSENGKLKTDVPIGLKLSYDDRPDWLGQFTQGEPINGPVSQMNNEDREFLALYDIKTIVIIPLFINDAFWGFFSIDDCEVERTFTNDEIDILHSVSLMMVNAFNRSIQSNRIRQANEYTELLLEGMPYSCNLWDENINLFKCNEGSVRIFELTNKQEFIEDFKSFSPEFQADGQRSVDKAHALVKKAFEEGYCITEWMHQKRDGTPIPAEVTLVRIAHDGAYVVAAYVRDLREEKEMLDEIAHNSNLLSSVNQVANILLQADIDSFEDNLQECISMIGTRMGSDRVCIWKNKIMDGRLYCDILYEWRLSGDYFIYSDAKSSDVSYDDSIPGWEEILSKGECINSTISEMSPVVQSQLRPHGVKSIFVAPVFVHNYFWGYVGFDDYHNEKILTDSEASTLYSGSLLIANALIRNEMMLNLQFANSAKSDFLARMSHEMRTPLNAIIGLTELAIEDQTINEETRLNIEKVTSAGELLLSTVNDILDISKIEAGKLELTPVRYDTPSLLNDTVTQSILHIGEKTIEFILNINEDLPAQLFGDDLRVKQMFNNLLSNAFKYTMEGSVELGVRCERDSDQPQIIWVTAWVKDTGVGIKEEQLNSLFSEFTQVDAYVNRHVVGTGLGLSITKRVVELMNGSIQVESEYGKGSTFTIVFEQEYVNDRTIGTEVVENLKSFRYSDQRRRRNSLMIRPKLPYASILVVDDNITNLDVAKGLLKPYSLKQIDCVISGQEAIDAIRSEKVRYNAILMDHMMPEMDGIEATHLIRELGTDYAKNIPIIACTANAISGNEQMFLKSGFQAFISKPIEIKRLDEIIRQWVRDKSQEKLYAQQHMAESDENNDDSPHIFDGVVIPNLDITSGIARFGGDEDTYLDVLRSFAENTTIQLENFKTVDEQKLSDYSIVVHGIKGSSRGICAYEIGDLSESLEKASKAGDIDFVLAYNETFLQHINDLNRNINKLLKRLSEEHPKPTKDKPDVGVLNKLMQACDSYDMDSVNDAMNELESFEYTSDEGLVEWIMENVPPLNFSQIVERLSLYLGND
ncbi:MAG: ATP-binding protein, partial [Oscillospiraceae bacterium]|nr:ATP-binding protein [Oscillospiraceae bacterium]